MLRVAFFLALGAMVSGYALTAHSDAMADRPPVLITDISGIPWTPPPKDKPQPKVVYGTDDRIDVFQEFDANRRAWAASTCAVVRSTNIAAGAGGIYTLTPNEYRPNGQPPCPTEPFRDQPVDPFCTGWMAAEDVVVTAGHCYDEGDLPTVYFVFGFQMADAATPVLEFQSNQVYKGIEVLGHAYEGDRDFTVIKVDRVITAPGAAPLPIRRTGAVAIGTPVGIIGHPAGLPTKIAFGAQTAVRSIPSVNYFVANTDSYGGNSGCPVIDPATGIVEGILVRGETDFISDGGCARSNVVANNAGRGEDCSTATSFAQYVPQLATHEGTITLDATVYPCDATAHITLRDSDLGGQGFASVHASAGGLQLVVTLSAAGGFGRFEGIVELPVLGARDGGQLVVAYTDTDTGGGAPGAVIATAAVDCAPPVITGITVGPIYSTNAMVRFTTDEPAIGAIPFNDNCDILVPQAITAPTAYSHSIPLVALSPNTTYYFSVKATDTSGNAATLTNGDDCFTFTTRAQGDYFTEQFAGGADVAYHTLTFIPDGSQDFYRACRGPAVAFPTDPGGGTTLPMADDTVLPVTLSGGERIRFFGVEYDTCYVSANGVVSFNKPEGSFKESIAKHFASPRVSLWHHDLDVSLQGTVSYRQLFDRFVVTYENVPQFKTSEGNFMQVEFFYDGRVRLTHLAMPILDGLVGLSGLSVAAPLDFAPSDLSAYGACSPGGPWTLSLETGGIGIGQFQVFPQQAFYSDGQTVMLTAVPGAGSAFNGWSGPGAADVQPDMVSENVLLVMDGPKLLIGAFGPPTGEGEGEGEGGGEGEGEGEGETPHYTADRDGNFTIDLSEILRAIQLYNSGALHCDPLTEDGYAPAAGDQSCDHYSADYAPLNWTISLNEILRVIQFYNSAGFTPCPGGEDGFCPAV